MRLPFDILLTFISIFYQYSHTLITRHAIDDFETGAQGDHVGGLELKEAMQEGCSVTIISIKSECLSFESESFSLEPENSRFEHETPHKAWHCSRLPALRTSDETI